MVYVIFGWNYHTDIHLMGHFSTSVYCVAARVHANMSPYVLGVALAQKSHPSLPARYGWNHLDKHIVIDTIGDTHKCL